MRQSRRNRPRQLLVASTNCPLTANGRSSVASTQGGCDEDVERNVASEGLGVDALFSSAERQFEPGCTTAAKPPNAPRRGHWAWMAPAPKCPARCSLRKPSLQRRVSALNSSHRRKPATLRDQLAVDGQIQVAAGGQNPAADRQRHQPAFGTVRSAGSCKPESMGSRQPKALRDSRHSRGAQTAARRTACRPAERLGSQPPRALGTGRNRAVVRSGRRWRECEDSLAARGAGSESDE